MRLIGFSGGMGVGKSTAIATLTEILGEAPTLVKFAGVLYAIQEFSYEQISPVLKRASDFKKDRKLLQWLGTEWGRGLDQDLWIKLWKAKVLQADSWNQVIVCDDVRFDNEAALIRDLGGTVIKLVRPDNVAHAEGGVGIANHSSEAGVDPQLIDLVLENSGSLEQFRALLGSVYSDILSEWAAQKSA